MNRFVLLLFLFLTALPTWAAEKKTTLADRRFLILVDTSMSMSDKSKTLRQTVFDLIHSGFNDFMRAGDSYEIWTFNSEVHSDGHAAIVWTPNKKNEAA